MITVDAPPVVTSATVTASPIAVGATITFSVTIENPNITPITGVNFSDTLPPEVEVATAPGVTNNCSGAVTTTGGAGGTVALSGANLASGASCTVTVQLTGVSAGTGTITTTPDANETLPGVAVMTSIQVIAIFPVLPTTVTQSIPGCRPFSESFSDGIPGTIYTYSGAQFPPGLTLNSTTGLLTGTPSTYGGYPETIIVTPPFGGTVVQHGYVFNEGLCIVPNTPVLPSVAAGNKFTLTLGGQKGTAPYRYQIQSGGLPTGLSMTQAGVISGTPTKPGTYTFTIYIFDSSNPIKTGTAPYTITIT
jgi:uncharacterized repeat protein (TIGR01451 family)